MAERRGATVHRHSWSQRPPEDPFQPSAEGWVRDQVTPRLDSPLAGKLTPHLLEVEDADHGMYVPGPLTDSVAVLGRVVMAVEEFLDAIGWPGAAA